MASTTVRTLGDSNYLSVTTYRRNGIPVATPVWVMTDGEYLYVITDSGSGKVKRLRHTPRVEVAECDMRGTIRGASHPATAQLLDAPGTQRVERLLIEKYGWQARALGAMSMVPSLLGRLLRRAPRAGRVGIRISLDAPGAEAAA